MPGNSVPVCALGGCCWGGGAGQEPGRQLPFFWCFPEESRNSIINSSLESVISSNANSFLNSNSAPQSNLNSSDLELEVIKPNRPNSL